MRLQIHCIFLEIKGTVQMKNKKYLLAGLLFILLFGFSLQAYGQESLLKGQGNIFGMIENIKTMKQDFLFLEQQIIMLEGECRG